MAARLRRGFARRCDASAKATDSPSNLSELRSTDWYFPRTRHALLLRAPEGESRNEGWRASRITAEGLRPTYCPADNVAMTNRLRLLESHWNWRFSAQCRVASLVTLWVVVLAMGWLGMFMVPLAATRTVASFGQTALNVRLGRQIPVMKQSRLDWLLIAAIFAGAEGAAVAATVTGNMHSPLLYLPMLIPFTVLQIRMTNRSLAAHDQQRAAKVVAFRLEKFQRTEAA